MKRNKKGFTLVEIIVVLVILAILAAIAVPTVLGYVDDAKEARELTKLRESLIAAQVSFVKSAAYGERSEKALTSGADQERDYYLTDNQKKDIRNYLDEKPYLLMFGTGNVKKYDATSKEASTVYCIAYQKTKTSKPWFYDGKKWSHRYLWGKGTNPGEDPSRAMYVKDSVNYMYDKNIPVTLYYACYDNEIVDQLTASQLHSFWDDLKNASE